MYKDIGRQDMTYCEVKEVCREAWSERFNYLCIDMTKNKMKVKVVFSMKSETYTLNAFTKPNLFIK